MDDSRLKRSTTGPASVLHDWFSVHRAMAGDVISLANLLGRPVLTADGSRVGRVDDVVVRWHADIAHPLVSGLLVQVEQGRGLLGVSDVTLAQSRAYLRRLPLTVRAPTLAVDDVALAHDVLDHQLVDVMGVKVVRAADIYLARTSQGWELAGVDVGFWAFVRRALPRRRKCPPPSPAVDWASVQAFVASTPGTARTGPVPPPTTAARQARASGSVRRPPSCASCAPRTSVGFLPSSVGTNRPSSPRWPNRPSLPTRSASFSPPNSRLSSPSWTPPTVTGFPSCCRKAASRDRR